MNLSMTARRFHKKTAIVNKCNMFQKEFFHLSHVYCMYNWSNTWFLIEAQF